MSAHQAKSALVVGANRGIGLNLVRALVARNWNVTGTVRPQTRNIPEELKDLKQTGAAILELDYLDERTIKAAAEAYGSSPLDLLINVGALGPLPDNWHEHTGERVIDQFRTNALGPFLAIKHFYPNLKKSSLARVIQMGSRSASISQNKGEDLGYRMSKTAMNQMGVTLAKEFQAAGDKIAVVSIYPGYLPTRLSNWRSRQDMDECIKSVVDVIEQIDLSQSGNIVNWKNELMEL